MNKKLVPIIASLIVLILLLDKFYFLSVEERMEKQSLKEYEYIKNKNLEDTSIIKLGYLSIFIADFDTEKSEEILDRVIEIQKENGEISDNVNSKLSTGLCVFSLIYGYEKTGKEKYKEAALKGGDFLIAEIEEWKATNEIKITEISKNARHEGDPKSSLECYYWTSPNDLGIMALGLGALAPYDTGYSDYARELGDALYSMQLKNGGWYDGYTQIPVRRDQSSWYVVMAMLGMWQCYKNLGDERYLESLLEAENWFLNMWDGGSVYDILAYEENYNTSLSEGRVEISEDLRFDYKRYEETNERDYAASSEYTYYYGEHSFLLAESLLINLGIKVDEEKLKLTFDHILKNRDEDPSNWFLLSLWLVRNRELEQKNV
ncbi:MAG: hypothetical protein J7L10_04115 [Methanomicrobia archaeon]|nr:hypothetical protein [Methanomicrobia archaeon]